MASIELSQVGVEFAIYNARGRSLRSDNLRRGGGRVDRSDPGRVTVRALSNITLSLKPGDRLALVGHNGAGKSTLLRVLCGAYEPSSGTARIVGKVSSLLAMTMGMDFELTGRQNIILRAVFLGLTFAQAEALVPEVAEFSGIGDFLDLPMRTYSSGMMLRVAFAVSTAVHADIILLDELISVGDADFTERARARLDQVLSRASILALASHDPKTLLRYCNRAVMLRGGEVVAEGDVEDVLAQHSG